MLPGCNISIPYRDHVVHTLAAPGGGGLVAKALMLLGLYDLSNLKDQRWALPRGTPSTIGPSTRGLIICVLY